MSEQHHSLKRHIGLVALILYGVGDILGAGIYGLIGKAAGEMGYATWLAFLVSMVAAGLTGLSYASLGSRYPRAAGAAYVTYRAFGNGFLSHLVGLCVLASGLTSMAAGSRVFAGYFTGLFVAMPLELALILFSFLIAGVVFWGIRESMFANTLCTLIELSGLVLVLIVGARYLGGANYLDASTPANPTGELSLSLALTGAVLTFYSFVGFEDMINVSEEVIDPKRTMPRGLIGAVLISSVIYMGISLVAVSVIPPAQLSASKQPLVDVVKTAAPWFPSPIYSFIAMFAVANTALLNFVMGSRLLYGMSRHGLMPAALGKVHPKRRTPHIAVLVVWILFVALGVSGDISSLAKATSVLLLSCFVVVNLSLLVLGRREKIEGTFNIPSFVPVGGAIVCLAMLTKAKSPELVTAGAMAAIIITLYLVMRPSPKEIEHMDEL